MNEVDLYRLGGTFFSLLETISEDKLVKQGAKNCFSSIMEEGYMAANRQVNYLCKTYYAKTLQSSDNPLKEMRYTLVTQDERNVKDLLDVFDLFGIDKSQISIDLNESQLFIDRETGAVSNSHKDYPKNKSEDKVVEADSKISPVIPTVSHPTEVISQLPSTETTQQTSEPNSIKTKSNSELPNTEQPNPSPVIETVAKKSRAKVLLGAFTKCFSTRE
jgi:hypothetical protein